VFFGGIGASLVTSIAAVLSGANRGFALFPLGISLLYVLGLTVMLGMSLLAG
jgi:hypothetical protein